MADRHLHLPVTGVLYTLYIIFFSAVIGLISDPFLPLTKLQFGFGPEIQRLLSGQAMENASRLPFVPHFLALVAQIYDLQLPALFIKNLFIQTILGYVLFRTWRLSGSCRIKTFLFIYILCFPQIIRHGFSLVP